tara:strand:+ start:1538 stop:2299 length:762 start_codon:yes stop_codon:yes gene_type:complete
MIPKTIHYCWFGKKPLPKKALNCINSWKYYFPDYEIKLWNEDNFDVNLVRYTKEAYQMKKYAFISDYARFWIIFHYGGIYFDTDVEVIQPMNDILAQGAYMGCEIDGRDVLNGEANLNEIAVNPGSGIAATSNLKLYKQILDFYESLSFINLDGTLNLTTIVKYTTDILKENGLKNVNVIQNIGEITIYPADYFCPIDYATMTMTRMTKNTRTIHHFEASWIPISWKIKKQLKRIIGKNNTTALTKIKKLFST